ncbi:MAG TPA: hypothetical protein VIM96_02520 [Pseudomonadales bacterium]
MHIFKPVFLMPLLILMNACSLVNNNSGTSNAIYLGGFDGTWEGRLEPISPNEYPFKHIDSGSWHLKLAIVNGEVSVFSRDPKNSAGWRSVMPGKFSITEHKTNAVVFAMASATDVLDKTGSGGWVETWNITLTKKDKASLYVVHTRAVNNYLQKPELQNGPLQGRFLLSSTGMLTKN